ncbi:MAG: efflux RND transporter periplasmic adaptor subunit [Candidatus Eisenbacteria bacterium]|nr:efflux RND transporter periplasmic adaptor subunit [Candidatus Eisenbacteria bacterium]
MKKLVGVLVVILVIALVVFVMMMAFRHKKAPVTQVTERVIPVEVQLVQRSPYTPVLNYTGEIKSIEEVLIYPRVSGKVAEMKIREGSMVRKNQVVALIDRDIPGLEFELAETISPVDGVVGKVLVDKGAEVGSASQGPAMGTPLAQILNMDSVKIVIQVLEQDLPRIRLGQKARIRVDAYPDREFYGAVTLVSPTLNNLTRTASAEITMPNRNHLLRPGMFPDIDLILGETQNLVFIPRYTILTEGNKQKVYVVVNGKAQERQLETGFTDRNLTYIKSGVSPKDSLVTSGQSQLKPGDKVRVVKGEGS